MTERVILHADMDAFFASVEQRDNPEYRGKPVIVGASSPRGVVSAASYEARVFGVRSAMPGFRARELCPHGIYVGGDMKKYAAVSREVHAVFAEFTDLIEPLSLDEAFLDITGSVSLLGSPLAIGKRLKERVREKTGLAVSVGIAPNKLIAKIACSRGKPDGLLAIERHEIPALLEPLPVRALWGIGPKAEQRLLAQGVSSIGQLARASLAQLSLALGDRAAELQARARGQDDRLVQNEREPQSIGEESTFPDDVSDLTRIHGALTAHAEAIASRARRAGFVGRTVTLKVKLSRRNKRGSGPISPHELFPLVSRQQRLPRPSSDGSEIRAAALHLLEKLALAEPVRLLGVSLSGLQSSTSPAQLDLFGDRPRPVEHQAPSAASPATIISRGERLGRALDAITDRFGTGAVRRAVDVPHKITASDRVKIGEREE